MGPTLDVYAVSTSRDAQTIARFLDGLVDRQGSEDRGDEQLMIVPLGARALPRTPEAWEWQPAHSLTHVIELGLSLPHRAFAVYLKPHSATIESAILAFTMDGQLVVGVSIPGAEESALGALPSAKALLDRLVNLTNAHSGFIGVEASPPLDGRVPDPAGSILDVWRRSNAV